MSNFIEVLNIASYVFMMFAAVICGVSIGLKTIVSGTLKKMIKLTDENFSSVTDGIKRDEVLRIIEDGKQKAESYAREVKNVNDIKRKNKWRKIFKMTTLDEPNLSVDKKYVYIDLARGIADVFYGDNQVDNSFLLFTEKELFYMVQSILDRADGIIKGAKITWFDKISAAFIVKCIAYYGAVKKFKKKQFVDLTLDVINFMLKVWSFISPVSMFKQILKGVSDRELAETVTDFSCEIFGKELAVIYMNKSL